LPWVETPRSEERFRHVNLLEAIFFLARLKPIIFEDFGFPPVLIFQSWERSLVVHDVQTRNELESFLTNVVAKTLGISLTSVEEIRLYAHQRPVELLERVERENLFVAPGGFVGEPLREAIERYKRELRTWRSTDFLDMTSTTSDAELVATGILERLEPQYHLIQNAEELRAQPLIPLSAQAHYLSKSGKVVENILVENNLLSRASQATIDALASERFEWLGNAPVESLVRMRLNNKNQKFRAQMAAAVDNLQSSSLAGCGKILLIHSGP
jgi:hypothetical protein